MEREEVYRVIDSERDYQESFKDTEESHIVSDFPLGSAMSCMQKILDDMRHEWYHEKAPYPNSMELVRKMAAVCVQMGETYGMEERQYEEV